MTCLFLKTLDWSISAGVTELFLQIVNMSISASWLVLAVLLLGLILRKSPKRVNILLWGIVAVKLICPFSIESAFSLIPSTETISPEIMMDWTPEINTGFTVLNEAFNPVITDTFAPQPASSANPLQILIPIASVIWIAGIALLLIYTLVSYWMLRRKVDTAVLLRYNIYQSEYVTTPFVLGIIKPGIYLPYTMSKEDIIYVVAHEKAHIHRRDHWWKPLGFLLLTIHWFNPLMWLAYKLFSRGIELACDEYVIENLDKEQRADYAQALLACSMNRKMAAACPIAFGEVGVKTRIKSVMNYKKPTFWIILVAVLLCLVMAVCFLTDPKPEEILMESTGPTEAIQPTAAAETDAATVAAESVTNGQEAVSDLAYFMELAVSDKDFQDMATEKQERILGEYSNLLDGYSLVARESTDGNISYIAGYFSGEQEENPLYKMFSFTTDDAESLKFVLYPEGEEDAVERALASNEVPENGYIIRNSHMIYSPKTGHILIHPLDSGWGFHNVFNKYLTSNGRDYMLDAASRGIALYTPDGPYLEVSLVSERWGEISEMIPLTQDQVNQIIAEPRKKLDEGHGFMARFELGPYSTINMGEDGQWFTEFKGVPQTVLELARDKCGYKFGAPKDINGQIVEARLDCDWLEEPLYADDADLERLKSILVNAEFGYVGACGYGAKLTVRMADGEKIVMFKGTDGCDTMVFGSYGGYFIGDRENQDFWRIFGLDMDTKEPLA